MSISRDNISGCDEIDKMDSKQPGNNIKLSINNGKREKKDSAGGEEMTAFCG